MLANDNNNKDINEDPPRYEGRKSPTLHPFANTAECRVKIERSRSILLYLNEIIACFQQKKALIFGTVPITGIVHSFVRFIFLNGPSCLHFLLRTHPPHFRNSAKWPPFIRSVFHVDFGRGPAKKTAAPAEFSTSANEVAGIQSNWREP